MRRRLLMIAIAAMGLGFAGQTASQARNPIPSSVPPVCIEQNLALNLHFQVGYCPGDPDR